MPDRKFFAAAFTALLLLPGPAAADTALATSARHFADPKKVGEAVLKYLFWDVYRAELFAPSQGWRPDAPFALSLN